jgi:hypothetical protein
MKIIGSKRFVTRHISRRLIALICIGAGILGVQVYRQANAEIPTHFLVQLPVERKPETPEQERDLSGYDLGGPVEECTWQEGNERKQCLIARDEARKFIYEHWLEKRKAYIAIDFPCVDCAPVLHVFIEPDDDGKWRIASRLEGRFGIHARANAYDLKYKKANEDERRLESTSKVLSFLDKDDEEVDSF